MLRFVSELDCQPLDFLLIPEKKNAGILLNWLKFVWCDSSASFSTLSWSLPSIVPLLSGGCCPLVKSIRPPFLLVNLASTSTPGVINNLWLLISGPQQDHQPSLLLSVFILPSASTLHPDLFFLSFLIPPPPAALSRDRSMKGCHGIDEVLSGEG